MQCPINFYFLKLIIWRFVCKIHIDARGHIFLLIQILEYYVLFWLASLRHASLFLNIMLDSREPCTKVLPMSLITMVQRKNHASLFTTQNINSILTLEVENIKQVVLHQSIFTMLQGIYRLSVRLISLTVHFVFKTQNKVTLILLICILKSYTRSVCRFHSSLIKF